MINKPTHLLTLLFIWAGKVAADGATVDKVYQPYVQPLETEIEWRAVLEEGTSGASDDRQTQRLGLGHAFSDDLFTEIYMIGEGDTQDLLALKAYEIEALWQLTEQGEYNADWGLLFELERMHRFDAWELAGGMLVAREWGRMSGVANLFAIYEWGEGVDNELETRLALQLRYRYSPLLEPALELYSGEDGKGAGPVLLGTWNRAGAQKLRWETGVILGLDDESPDSALRFLLEYEF
jgi:hypothetical protein